MIKKVILTGMIGLTLVAGLSACSDKKSEPQKVAQDNTMTYEQQQQKKVDDFKNTLPHADPSVPEASYFRTTPNNNDVLFARLAVSDKPVDYDRVAYYTDKEYSQTSDAFKKKELLDKLKPKIDERIAFAKEHRYLVLISDHTVNEFSHYDFDKKGFRLNRMADGRFSLRDEGFNRVKSDTHDKNIEQVWVYMTNPKEFSYVYPTSEENAKKLETIFQTNLYDQGLRAEYYVVIQATVPESGNDSSVYGELTKIKIVDLKGNVLAESPAMKQ